MTTRIWTGTASVVSGYTTVVLSGDPLTDANCPADATIVLGGATYFVSERVDTTTVELTRPYEGVDDSAITAEIDPMSTTTTSLVTLSTQISTYDARVALIDANGRGLFYKSKGFTGADDPAAGYLGRNASDWADVTELYFDILDQNGQDISHLLDLITSGDVLIVRSIDTNAVADFTVNALDDNTGWYTVTVTYLGGTDIIADEEDIAIEWRRIGGGIQYDAQTTTEAGLGAYEIQAVGYKVLVGNYQGTGRAAVFTLLATGSPSSWSDPAFITGPQGEAASVEVGTVSTLAAGASATVTNSGTESEAVLDFGIPQGAKGDKGDTGDAATIAVGTVTTLDPGESATVTNAGTSGAAILNFGIPKGDGLDYDVHVDTVADREAYEGEAPGYRVLVTDVGDGRAAIYELITSGSPSDWSDPIYLTGESGTNIWDAIVDDPGGLELYESEEVGYRVLVSDVGNGRSAIYQLQSQGSPSDWYGPIYLTGATGEVAGAVASVNGQQGIVVLDAGDIAFDPTGSPTGTLESTTVQDAIVELDFEKGIVWEIVAGNGISVDNSDPAAPVISAAPVLKGATIHVVDTLGGGSPQNTYAPGEVIDGVTLSAGMIVGRFTSGGDPADGIFLVGTTGPALRHSDFDTWDKCAGAYFPVMMGTANADTLWRCTSDPGGTLDTDPLVFEQRKGKFSGVEKIKTSAYTATASDSGDIIILNKATADTLSFEAAATLGSTWMVMVKNMGAGTWTLDPNGAETIDGAATIDLAQNESAVISCNGTALRSFFIGGGGGGTGDIAAAADRTALLALDTGSTTEAFLKEAGREGIFVWDGSDLSGTLLGADIASSAVDSSTDTITSTAHGLRTGDPVITTTAVNGLALNTIYYAIRTDDNNFQLASSFADAMAGTDFDLTGTTAVTVKRHYDAAQGIYVTPTATLSGASGAWVRQDDEHVSPGMCGAQATSATEFAALSSGAQTTLMTANAVAVHLCGLLMRDLGYEMRGPGLDKPIYVNNTFDWRRAASGNTTHFHIEELHLDFSESGLTSGTALYLGAISNTHQAERGSITLRDIRLYGPETTNPASAVSADTSMKGLVVERGLNYYEENVTVSRFHRGSEYAFCFPATLIHPQRPENFTGMYMGSATNDWTVINAEGHECWFSYVFKYSSSRLVGQTWIEPRVETCEVGFVFDCGSQTGGADRMRNITIIDPWVSGVEYDIFRVCRVWEEADPADIDTDNTDMLVGLNIRGGNLARPNSGAWSATAAAIRGPSSGTVFRAINAELPLEDTANAVQGVISGGQIVFTGTTHTAVGSAFYKSKTVKFDSLGNRVIVIDNDTQGANVTINRTGNDGSLILFQQDGTTEGNINVSGTTVALSGAHLSRWSQWDGPVPESALPGTVLANRDVMCEWPEQKNEQLNRVAVSDTEGDRDIAGVFQSYDMDDDLGDFYVAQSGDYYVRVGEGVEVARGDLLMSAGDGTAKPQSDDIVRSSTLAKVLSPHVIRKYDDGSYLVPCVLMVC